MKNWCCSSTLLNIGPFTFDERAFGTHRIGGGVGCRGIYQESNLYSSLAQARGLVALIVLIEVRLDKNNTLLSGSSVRYLLYVSLLMLRNLSSF
jgi:hypothetical protein